MEKELITLSKKEIERLKILHMVIDRSMTQVDASQILGITDRQVRNIIGKIRVYGDKATNVKHYFSPTTNKIPVFLFLKDFLLTGNVCSM